MEAIICLAIFYLFIYLSIYLFENHVPYTKRELRKAIHQRNVWKTKHFKNKRNSTARDKCVMSRADQPLKAKNGLQASGVGDKRFLRFERNA